MYVVYSECFAGSYSLYAGLVKSETEKTIRITPVYGKVYHTYRTLLNKKHDRYILVGTEAEVIELFNEYTIAQTEHEEASAKFRKTVLSLTEKRSPQ